jgi:hypothetical protein
MHHTWATHLPHVHQYDGLCELLEVLCCNLQRNSKHALLVARIMSTTIVKNIGWMMLVLVLLFLTATPGATDNMYATAPAIKSVTWWLLLMLMLLTVTVTATAPGIKVVLLWLMLLFY